MKLIILILLVMGCGKGELFHDFLVSDKTYENTITVNEFLKPYYTQFESICNLEIHDTTAKFGDLEDTTVGRCYSYSNGYREIIIDKPYWDNASLNQKESLMLHELGHCVLYKEHNSAEIEIEDISIKESIMYPFVIGSYWYYDRFKEYYYEELCE